MSFRLLVVDPDLESRTAVERALAAAGNFVTCVSGFEQAKQRLLFAPPDLLITALKLGSYNGIQLVLRAHAENPAMPALVLHDVYDPVLEQEAINAGAVYLYLTKPADERSVSALVEQLLADAHLHGSAAVPRKWPRKEVSVPARVGSDDAKVVEVSYSGLRLELSGVPDEQLSRIATVYIPDLGTVPVHPVWARGGTGAAGRWWCGVEVNATDQNTAAAWRRFVDSLK
jgi:CheY-like chemotaxis protein